VSIPDDVEYLISHLAGPLAPNERRAFRAAAEAAIAGVVCPGPGTIYRAVSQLQKAFFDPPSDGRAGWDITADRTRASKLISRPPIGYGRSRDGIRQRRLVG
jgi:hypothetical protein